MKPLSPHGIEPPSVAARATPTTAQPRRRQRTRRGFTLMELVVVMTVIGLLLTLALPRYLDAIDRGKAKVLERNLALMREAIDRYYGDQGRYPERLEELVTKRYLRAIPPDPFLEKATWVVIVSTDANLAGVIDIESTGTDDKGLARSQRGGSAGAEGDATPGPAVNPRTSGMDGSRQTVTIDAPGEQR
jgi:general secretion pathway protein G